MNPTAEAITGWSSAEAHSRDITQIAPIYDVSMPLPQEHPLKRTLREGVEVSLGLDAHLTRRDGSSIPIADSAAPIRDDHGSVIGAVMVFHDLIERVHMERRSAIFASLGRQLSAATSPLEAARIIASVSDELLHWDAFLFDLYSAEENLCQPILNIDIIDNRRVELPTPLAPHAPTPLAQGVFNEGPQLIYADSPVHESLKLLPFGDTGRPSETLMFVAVRSGAQVIGLISVQSYTPRVYNDNDLANLQALADHCGGAIERIRVEAALRESESRFRLLAEHTRDLVCLNDIDGPYRYVSPSSLTLLGYAPEELIGQHPSLLMHPDDLYLIGEMIVVLRRTQPSMGLTYRIRTKAGDYIWFEMSAQPIVNPDGTVTSFISSSRDVTGRKVEVEARQTLERRLMETQKLESLEVLASGVAHEYNNLITVMLGKLELIAKGLASDPAMLPHVQEIEGAIQRAAQLNRQLMLYAGRSRLTIQSVDVNALIRDLSLLLRAALPRHVSLHYELADCLPLIDADLSQVRQVIMNLALNGAEAIDQPEGVVTFKTSLRMLDRATSAALRLTPDGLEGQFVCIEIADTGAGMADTTVARAFEPFFTTKFGGRGLGLSAALGTMRAHRGAIQLMSAPGHGSSCLLFFPVQSDYPVPPIMRLHPQSIMHGAHSRPISGSGTILVVDDEDDVRAIAVRALTDAGFDVLEAGDGVSGIAMFTTHADIIAAVVLDFALPNLTGVQVFHEIQHIKPGTPVVLMSGFAEVDTAHLIHDAALVGFLQKPFTMRELQLATLAAVSRPNGVNDNQSL
jgi:PAS domain S-box-containing protein